mmetsp:Transcript_49581/g.106132  ORF Transcript_49581/g.106132 Transcript_49581/m.106132 type:complete len:119 (-) Transcript_49581:1591-1947(-)
MLIHSSWEPSPYAKKDTQEKSPHLPKPHDNKNARVGGNLNDLTGLPRPQDKWFGTFFEGLRLVGGSAGNIPGSGTTGHDCCVVEMSSRRGWASAAAAPSAAVLLPSGLFGSQRPSRAT